MLIRSFDRVESWREQPLPERGKQKHKKSDSRRRPWKAHEAAGKPHPGISMLAANITTWGPQAEKYLGIVEHDILMISEHRQAKRRDLEKMLRGLGLSGWRAAASPAQRTSEAGASGGVMVCWKANMQATAVELDVSKQYAHRVAAAILKLAGGIQVLLVTVYGHTGDGEGPSNIALLEQLGIALESYPLWIAAGDWNMQPAEIEHSGWLQQVRGRIVAQSSDVETGTCFTKVGRLPTYLDFFVVSASAVPLVAGSGLDLEAPFGTHRAVKAVLASRPRVVKVPQTKKVQEIPKAKAGPGISWTAAAAKNKEQKNRAGHKIVEETLEGHPRRQEMAALEHDLQNWGKAAEFWHLSRSGLAEKEWVPYQGRCQPLKIRWVNFGGGKGRKQTTAQRAIQVWASVAHAFRDLQTIGRQQGLLNYLQKIGDQIGKEPQLVPGGESEQLAWRYILASATEWAHEWDNMQLAAGVARRHFEQEEKKEKRDEWKEWLDSALAQAGAPKAHKVTKGTAKATPITPEAGRTVLADQAKFWQGLWSRDQIGKAPLIGKLECLRQKIKENNEQPEYTFVQFMQQIRRTKQHAGKGIDQLSRDFVLTLPAEGQQALHKIISKILADLVLPDQCLAAIVALLPKPGSAAYRPIALLHFVYRWIQKRLRWEVAQWDDHIAGPWDYGRRGRGAEAGAFAEDCETELRLLDGQYAAGALLDMEKLYDNCSLELLFLTGMQL